MSSEYILTGSQYDDHRYRKNSPHVEALPSGRRVGHADRDRYVDHLTDMYGSGHLKEAEYEERRDQAFAAVTEDDLYFLVRDLPPVPPPPKVKTPEPEMVKARYQLIGKNIPFSPMRWAIGIALSLGLIAFPVPMMCAIFGGFAHAPGDGSSAVLMVLAGIISLLVTGVGFSEDPAKAKTVRKDSL